MKLISAWLIPLAALANAEPQKVPTRLHPSHFQFTRSVEAALGSALYRVDLPEDVYEGVAHDDLRDLRVFNAEGQVVPSSFQLKPSEQVHETVERNVGFFPVLGEIEKTYEGASTVQIQQGSNRTVTVRFGGTAKGKKTITRGYLVDLREEKRSLRRLELDWEGAAENSFFSVRFEGSDNLTDWRPLAGTTTLARFRFGGESLEQKAVDLPDTGAKYLLLTWSDNRNFVLKSLKGEFTKGSWVETKRHATSVATREGEPGEYLFEKSPLVADRLQIGLPVINTLLRVEVESRAEEKDHWSPRSQGLVYRVQVGERELSSGPLKVTPTSDRFWRFKIVGKDASLGRQPPKVEFGWIAHQLFFLAQGKGPFLFAYGLKEARTADFGFHSLSDTLSGESEDLKPLVATLGGPIRQEPLALTPVPPSAEEASDEKKKYVLWASLGSAILLTSLMAWKLLRDIG